ncbi:hypothetical protein D3C76_542010 [compost metagenome]
MCPDGVVAKLGKQEIDGGQMTLKRLHGAEALGRRSHADDGVVQPLDKRGLMLDVRLLNLLSREVKMLGGGLLES